MNTNAEIALFRTRIALVQAYLRDRRYDGILLSRIDNFAMATGGKRNYVSMMTDVGACSLYVSKDGATCFVGNNIEEPRVMSEELDGLCAEVHSFLWYEDNIASVAQRAFSGNVVSDDGSLGANVHADLACLRATLSEAELEKYRRLGALAASAMTRVIESIDAGMSENEITARLIAEGAHTGCRVPVALVASDDRIARFRHPLAAQRNLVEDSGAEHTVQDYVMVVGGFYKEGLTVSITRFKQVGAVHDAIHDASLRIAGVDAVMQEETQPGRTLGEVFAACQRAYASVGFPEDEWHHHHQGGLTGYGPRTFIATPGVAFPLLDDVWARRVSGILGEDVSFGHAVAWNPSATGVKSEDTFILRPDGTKEIVTATPSFPQVDLTAVLGRETDVQKSGMAES